ncbi:MAG TPA: uridine kinase [Flavobacteriaceae bacterium]|nr:uridine kinase [Flavobacteriaceae bacterium]
MKIIGIAGGTGSGKTTVVHRILEELSGQVDIIYQDSYYKDNSHLTYEERCKINFDHPQSIDFDLLTEHLQALKEGKSVEQPVYSFKEHNRSPETITIRPQKVLLVEGILVFAHEKLRKLFDLKIFVHTDSDERLIRRLKRDIHERGRDMDEVLDRYQNTLKPMHQQFIEPTKEFADLIIPYNRYNEVGVNVVQTIVRDCIK